MNNRLAVHFVYTKYISVVPYDDVSFVVQAIVCSFQTFIRDDVRNEIRYIGYLI